MKIFEKVLLFFLCFLMSIAGLFVSNALADGYGNNAVNENPPWNNEKSASPCSYCKDCDDIIRASSDDRGYFHNGSESINDVDLFLPGEMPIRIQRTYNSQATFDSALGYGWDFSFNERLRTYSDNSVVIRNPAGRKIHFVFTGGVYVCEESPHLALIKIPDGSFIFEASPTATRRHYDREGRLVRKDDKNGNSLRMTHSSNLEPLIGLSPHSITPDISMVVSNNHQLQRVEQFDATGTSTGRYIDFSYNGSSGRLTSVADSTGRTASYQHDSSGNLIRVDYPEGLFKTYQYNDSNDPHNMTSNLQGYDANPPVLLTEREYDTDDRLIREEYAGGTLEIDYTIPLQKTTVTRTIADSQGIPLHKFDTIYEFNSQGYLLKTTDEQKAVEFVRDSRNNITENILWVNNGTLISPDLVEEFSIESVFNATNDMVRSSVALESGEELINTYSHDNGMVTEHLKFSTATPDKVHRTSIEYNHTDNLPTTVSAINQLVSNGPTSEYYSVTFEYNNANQPIAVQFQNGDRNTQEYDTGLLRSRNGVIYQLDNRGNVLSSEDRNGTVTQFEYDDLGRNTKMINAMGEETHFTYTGWHLSRVEQGKTAESGGEVHNLVYDAYGRLLHSSIDLDGSPVKQETFTYDSDGNILTVTDQQGRSASFSYDPWNRLLFAKNSSNNESVYTYNYAGLPTTIRDPLGNTTTYEYDKLGRQTRITDSLGGSVSFVLDENNQVIKITDTESKEILFTYNLAGQMVVKESPVTGIQVISYDNQGRVSRIQYPDASIDTYQYDTGNRLQQIRLADGTAEMNTLRYGYDTMGNLLWYSDSRHGAEPLINMTYDILGRLKTKTLNPINKTLVFDYTARGQQQKMTIQENGSELFSYLYVYDKAGRVTSMTEQPVNKTTLFQHDPSGLVTGRIYANGTTASSQYSNDGLLTELHYRRSDNSTIEHYQYSYNFFGRIKEIINNQGTTTYDYDTLSRLNNVTYPASSALLDESYTYDITGNRLTSSNITDWTYNDNGQLLAYNGHAFAYDDRGRQTSETSGGEIVLYTYDRLDRLTEVSSTGMQVVYSYGPANRRFRKTVNGINTWYLYNGANILAEFDNAGQLTRNYSYQPASYDLVGITEGVTYYTALTNHLQTTEYVSDSNQTTIWQASYQAFGDTVIQNDADNDGSTFSLPHRFPGQYYDSETNKYYNWHRLYDQKTGRYTSADPIGLAGGMNLYAYNQNNPVGFIDPHGLKSSNQVVRVLTSEDMKNITRSMAVTIHYEVNSFSTRNDNISGYVESSLNPATFNIRLVLSNLKDFLFTVPHIDSYFNDNTSNTGPYAPSHPTMYTMDGDPDKRVWRGNELNYILQGMLYEHLGFPSILDETLVHNWKKHREGSVRKVPASLHWIKEGRKMYAEVMAEFKKNPEWSYTLPNKDCLEKVYLNEDGYHLFTPTIDEYQGKLRN